MQVQETRAHPERQASSQRCDMHHERNESHGYGGNTARKQQP